MPEFTNDELIAKAASVLNPHKVGNFWMGDVGCALRCETGRAAAVL